MFPAIILLAAPPALALGFAESYWALVAVGFVLGVAGSSFAVGVPFVAGWYASGAAGVRRRRLRDGNIGTAVAAFSAPAIVDGLGPPGARAPRRRDPPRRRGDLLAARAGPAPVERAPTRYRDVLRAGWRLWRLPSSTS